MFKEDISTRNTKSNKIISRSRDQRSSGPREGKNVNKTVRIIEDDTHDLNSKLSVSTEVQTNMNHTAKTKSRFSLKNNSRTMSRIKDKSSLEQEDESPSKVTDMSIFDKELAQSQKLEHHIAPRLK
jgi:hypothetical protein